MDLITLVYCFAAVLVGLFLLGFVSEIVRWWFSASTPKAKARRDWEF